MIPATASASNAQSETMLETTSEASSENHHQRLPMQIASDAELARAAATLKMWLAE
jgi:hypothetical protein